jgi:hypothetical protein
VLEYTASDANVSKNERDAAAEMLAEILDDRFLFILHFHFDLHECISGEIKLHYFSRFLKTVSHFFIGELTKIMQKDDISYKVLMDTVAAKKQILLSWVKKKPDGTCPWGPSLSEYLDLTEKESSFGAFNILSKTHRDELAKECFIHAEQLLKEIDCRFPPSKLHQHFSTLFDPVVLKENQHCLDQATYGHLELNYLRQKYEKFPDFNAANVHVEWESFKPLLINFISIQTDNTPPATFWRTFIQLKLVTHEQFAEKFKNILILLGIFLISPLNAAECERGYSAANRIQTKLRSRITIETLDCPLTVRLLLSDDIRR